MCTRRVLAAVLGALLWSGGAAAQDSDHDGVPDGADAYPCDPALAAVRYAPAEGAYGTLMFEDQWPEAGDVDMNDVVLAYHYEAQLDARGHVVRLVLLLEPLALGGQFDNGLAASLPLAVGAAKSVTLRVDGGAPVALVASPSDADLVVVLMQNLRAAFDGRAGPINSTIAAPRLRGASLRLEVELASPRPVALHKAPFDLFVFRSADPSLEIHRSEYAGTSRFDPYRFGTGADGSTALRRFVDRAGLPYVLVLPDLVPYPSEGTSIAALYPDIVAFAASGGREGRDFYRSRVALEHRYMDVQGEGPLSPRPLPLYWPNTSCVPPSAPIPLPPEVAAAPQMYCNGTCSWGGDPGCDQSDADIFCRLREGRATARAAAFTTGPAQAAPGLSCGRGTNYGPQPQLGVHADVWYQERDLRETHGPGAVIDSVRCE